MYFTRQVYSLERKNDTWTAYAITIVWSLDLTWNNFLRMIFGCVNDENCFISLFVLLCHCPPTRLINSVLFWKRKRHWI